MDYGFTVVDYVIFAVMITLSLGIGVYYALSGGKQKTTSEYLVGNRQMSMLPVAVSLVVSFESSILVLGYPAEVYIYGVMQIYTSICSLFVMVIATRITVPLFHPLKLTSAFEYFELRYRSRAPRVLGTLIGMLYYVVYMGIVMYGPAIALEAVTDFPFWASVLSVSAASIIYTSIGGLKAVIWTDVLQCVIMLLGMLFVIIKGVVDIGNVQSVWKINEENLRLNFFDFNPNPIVRHTFWSLTIGSLFGYSGYLFNQSTVQRVSCLASIKDAKRILLLTGPAFFLFGALVNIEGLVMFAYFNSVGCDPLKSGDIQNPNQLLPYMVVRIFKNTPGLSGVFLASLFSASLSTLSSGLSSLSAQTVHDFIKPRFKDMTDRKAAAIAKVSVVFYGCLSVCITAMTANISGSLSQISSSLLTSIAGPLTGMYLYSVFCPWATKKGLLVGGSMSILLILWLTIGYNFLSNYPRQPWLPLNPLDSCPVSSANMSNSSILGYNSTTSRLGAYQQEMLLFKEIKPQGIDNLYAISFRWYGMLGVLMSIFVGSAVSLITGYPRPDEVDVRYILPIGDQLFPYLPRKARRYLEFGVDFKKRKIWLEKLQEQRSKENAPSGGIDIDIVTSFNKTDNEDSVSDHLNAQEHVPESK